MNKLKTLAELEIWFAEFEKRKREMIAAGMSREDADNKAATEIRHQIRQSGSGRAH
jgi:hypothetical protein